MEGLAICTRKITILPYRINSLPTISALKFNGALTMAVGTSTGQVMYIKYVSVRNFTLKLAFQCACVVGNPPTFLPWEQTLRHHHLGQRWVSTPEGCALSAPGGILIWPGQLVRDAPEGAAVGTCPASSRPV